MEERSKSVCKQEFIRKLVIFIQSKPKNIADNIGESMNDQLVNDIYFIFEIIRVNYIDYLCDIMKQKFPAHSLQMKIYCTIIYSMVEENKIMINPFNEKSELELTNETKETNKTENSTIEYKKEIIYFFHLFCDFFPNFFDFNLRNFEVYNWAKLIYFCANLFYK